MSGTMCYKPYDLTYHNDSFDGQYGDLVAYSTLQGTCFALEMLKTREERGRFSVSELVFHRTMCLSHCTMVMVVLNN